MKIINIKISPQIGHIFFGRLQWMPTDGTFGLDRRLGRRRRRQRKFPPETGNADAKTNQIHTQHQVLDNSYHSTLEGDTQITNMQ